MAKDPEEELNETVTIDATSSDDNVLDRNDAYQQLNERTKVLRVEAERRGWGDLFIAIILGLLLIGSLVTVLVIFKELVKDFIGIVIIILFGILILSTALRIFCELTYQKDFLEISSYEIEFRSTPFFANGFRIRKGTIQTTDLVEISVVRINRVPSIDFRKMTKIGIVFVTDYGRFLAGERLPPIQLLKSVISLEQKDKQEEILNIISEDFPEIAKELNETGQLS